MRTSSRRPAVEYGAIALLTIKTALYVGLAWLAIFVFFPLLLAALAAE